MLRTFSETELAEMCKKRPPEYKADIVALAVVRPDGLYELDTGTDAYFKLKNKYAAAPLPPRFNAPARQQAQQASLKITALSQAKDRLKSVNAENVYSKGVELVSILGEASAFAYAYAEFLQLEKRGGCRSCQRKGQLRKLMTGLKLAIMGAAIERKQKVREIFADTVFFEVVPAPVKWDDLMK